eukprot:EG_transcript_7174
MAAMTGEAMEEGRQSTADVDPEMATMLGAKGSLKFTAAVAPLWATFTAGTSQSVPSSTYHMAASAGSTTEPKAPQGEDMDLDNYTPSELETMYINALWAYYTEGKAIFTDEQFSKLKLELSWQGSGFPALRRDEVEFVKAVIAYQKGEPILSNEEYDKLKNRIKEKGKRQDVTAYLLAIKGKDLLPPEKYAKLKEEMRAAGVRASPSGLTSTLSETPNTLQYEVLEVLTMYSALGLVPSAICASGWGFLAFLLGGLKGVGTMATVGFPVIGASSFLLTREMIRYLDLTGPKLVKGTCPCCETPIQASFFDCTPAAKVEKCPSCGTLCNLDSEKMLIRDAAGFSYIGEAEDKKTVDQYLSWASGVTSGILVGKNPVSMLGGRKAEGGEKKPTNIPSMIQQEIKVGIFAWAILLGYGLFGETFVSRVRGKGIAVHSGVINDFCKRFNIPNGLRQKYIQTAKRNGHDLGFLVDGYGLIGDGLFGK